MPGGLVEGPWPMRRASKAAEGGPARRTPVAPWRLAPSMLAAGFLPEDGGHAR